MARLSKYQKAVCEAIYYLARGDRSYTNGKDDLMIAALAGSGKTFILTYAMQYMLRNQRAIALMFNTRNADDIRPKLPQGYNVEARTTHSLGGRVLKRNGGGVLDEDHPKMRGILNEMQLPLAERRLLPEVKQLISVAKALGIVPHGYQGAWGLQEDTPEVWRGILDHFSIDFDEGWQEDRAVAIARDALKISLDTAHKFIDYDDMLFLPVVLRMPIPKYDWVFVDECFVGATPILIDRQGKSMTIKEMYDSRYSGTVMTWDESVNRIEERKVVGAKRVPVGKPLIRIVSRRHGYAKDGTRLSARTERVKYGQRALICTEDHEISVTREGGVREWVAAKNLRPGDTITHESCAPLDRSYQNRYKHMAEGRAALSAKADRARFGGFIPPAAQLKSRRGGNGTGPSAHEALLLDRLGQEWRWNYVVATHGRKHGYPTNYKIDLANPAQMIAIEVDGHSHVGRTAQDAKKTGWLESQGWTVVRISNKEVRALTDDLLRERIFNSPVDAMVLKVEPWANTRDLYVYDLEVEGTHCYFAHGILVHNCQDINPVQRELIKRARRPGGHVVAVGDENQAIYGFRSAGVDSMRVLKEELDAHELPLSICYRCDKEIIRHARHIVPAIEYWDQREEGKVMYGLGDGTRQQKLAEFTPDAVILGPRNAPLVAAAFGFIRKRIACHMIGRDFSEGLVKLLQKLDARIAVEAEARLEEYRAAESIRLEGRDAKLQSLLDKCDTLRVFLSDAPPNESVARIIAQIEALFDETAQGMLTLSSIHRSKGSEYPRVFLMDTEMLGATTTGTKDKTRALLPWEMQQRKNLLYVGVTRAMHELYFVTVDDMEDLFR